MKKRLKKVIGRRDKVDFPELCLQNIDAKIDTGAYSSAIHCHNIEPLKKGGVLLVRFNLLDPSHPAYNEQDLVMPVHSVKLVRSSTGHAEERYMVRTAIMLFNQPYITVLSLCSREDMRFPVLLGRRILYGNFVVDVARSNLSYRQKLRKKSPDFE